MHAQCSLLRVELVLKHRIKVEMKQHANLAVLFWAVGRFAELGLGFQLEAVEPTP